MKYEFCEKVLSHVNIVAKSKSVFSQTSIILTPALSIHKKIRTFLVFVFSFLPLGSTTLVESRVDKLEGKILFCSAELKSPDGKVTFVTANALFIQLDTQGKGEVDVDKMRLHFRDLSY